MDMAALQAHMSGQGVTGRNDERYIRAATIAELDHGNGGVLESSLVYHLQFQGPHDHCCQIFLFCTLVNHVATIAKTNY